MEGAERETILCETLFSKFKRVLLYKLEHQRHEHQTTNKNGKSFENISIFELKNKNECDQIEC